MRFFRLLFNNFIRNHVIFIVTYFWGSIWKLRKELDTGSKFKRNMKHKLYSYYLDHYGAWIGEGAIFEETPKTPHGLYGIFISNQAKIGKNVVIMQQVTIGSNTTIGSSKNGSPTIHDGVYIGAGAKLIGKIDIGENSRIGANAIVVKDTPPNSVTVIRNIESIIKTTPLDNRWVNMFPDGMEKID